MQESKQETQFRIGGVYRAVNGEVYRLSAGHEDIVATYAEPNAWAKCKDDYGAGFRSLIDGRDMDPDGLPKECGCRDLIPGELHQVDGQWLPLDAQEESDLPELVKNFQERELRKAYPTPADLADDELEGLFDYGFLPADLAMIARDGPAKPNGKPILPGQSFQFFAAPTTKPPIAGLTRVSAQDHRVGGWGFVR